MKAILKAIAHAAIGGVAAGLAVYTASGAPLTAKNVLYPALASAITSVLSLFAPVPGAKSPE